MVSLAPHNVVSSKVYNWVPILENMFTDIRGGTRGDATFVIDLGNGGEKIVLNNGYHLAAPIKAEGEKLIKEITEGIDSTAVEQVPDGPELDEEGPIGTCGGSRSSPTVSRPCLRALFCCATAPSCCGSREEPSPNVRPRA